jgi:hypothetical protein
MVNNNYQYQQKNINEMFESAYHNDSWLVLKKMIFFKACSLLQSMFWGPQRLEPMEPGSLICISLNLHFTIIHVKYNSIYTIAGFLRILFFFIIFSIAVCIILWTLNTLGVFICAYIWICIYYSISITGSEENYFLILSLFLYMLNLGSTGQTT